MPWAQQLSSQQVRQAEPSLLSKAQISQLAEQVAQSVRFRPGDDIQALVPRLGGHIRVEDTLSQDPERSGSLFVQGPGSFTIVVSAHTSALRDNFTVAHELGHYYIHYLWRNAQDGTAGGPMVALRRGSERVEWEANWFAGSFLMPEGEFRLEFERAGSAIPVIARRFAVSPMAAQIRAKQLGLL